MGFGISSGTPPRNDLTQHAFLGAYMRETTPKVTKQRPKIQTKACRMMAMWALLDGSWAFFVES